MAEEEKTNNGSLQARTKAENDDFLVKDDDMPLEDDIRDCVKEDDSSGDGIEHGGELVKLDGWGYADSGSTRQFRGHVQVKQFPNSFLQKKYEVFYLGFGIL